MHFLLEFVQGRAVDLSGVRDRSLELGAHPGEEARRHVRGGLDQRDRLEDRAQLVELADMVRRQRRRLPA